MPRTNRILIRSGTVAPTASDFSVGEPAFDKSAGKFYVKNAAGAMVEIGAGGGGSVSVVEYATTASFPATGASATLYLATDTRRLYSWTGSVYAEVGAVASNPTDSRWDLFLPPAPTGLTGASGDNQVTLTWTAPTVVSATPVTDYLVQYSSNSGSTWTTFADGTSSSTSATVTGLTNGTAYVFRVAAVNGVGTGSYSSASSSVTPAFYSYTAIPVMTSATAPSGTVSDSGVLSGSTLSWYAFNKSVVSGDTTFYASASPATNNWIQYDYGFASSATGYQITSRQLYPYGSTQAPPAWTLSGSSDGTNFTVIDTRTSITWNSSGEQKSFTLSQARTYRYWRWTWTADSSASTVVLPKIQLTG